MNTLTDSISVTLPNFMAVQLDPPSPAPGVFPEHDAPPRRSGSSLMASLGLDGFEDEDDDFDHAGCSFGTGILQDGPPANTPFGAEDLVVTATGQEAVVGPDVQHEPALAGERCGFVDPLDPPPPAWESAASGRTSSGRPAVPGGAAPRLLSRLWSSIAEE